MAERPLECSHCKRTIQVTYKEIVSGSEVCTEMCGECPIFQQKLHGQALSSNAEKSLTENEGALCCGTCRTPLEAIKMGNPLGCSECYAIFSDALITELSTQEKIPLRLKKEISTKKMQPLHIGKSPRNPLNLPSSSRLTSLNEALNEALKKENYEQAAWLRDQIKALMEKPPHDGKST